MAGDAGREEGVKMKLGEVEEDKKMRRQTKMNEESEEGKISNGKKERKVKRVKIEEGRKGSY